jgi:hypothetical protein
MNEQSFIYCSAKIETDLISWSSLTLFNIEPADCSNEALQMVFGVFVVGVLCVLKLGL